MFRNLSKFPVKKCIRHNNVRCVSHTLNFQGTFPGILRKSIIQAWRPMFANPTNLSARYENVDETSYYERLVQQLRINFEPKTVLVSPTFEILNKYASKVEGGGKGGKRKAKFSFKTAGKIRKFIRDKHCAFFGTNGVLKCTCKKGGEDVDAEKAKKKRKKPKKDLPGPCPYIKEECLKRGKTGGGGGKKGPCKLEKKGHCKKAVPCKKKGEGKKTCGAKVSKTVCKKGGGSDKPTQKSTCKKPDKPRCSSAGKDKKSSSKPICKKVGGDKPCKKSGDKKAGGGKPICKPKPKVSCEKKKEDSCKKKDDPCKPKKGDSCKKKQEDPCKQKDDPCKAKKGDSCKKKQEDPCKQKKDSCKKTKEDHCKKRAAACKNKNETKEDDPCKKEASCIKGGASGDPCGGLPPAEKRKCERERENWLKKKACWEKKWKK